MDFNYIEKNIIFKYYETLIRKNISNIDNHKFIKKPYLENYIIELSSILDNNILHTKINTLLDSNKITNEEIFLFINNNIELNNEQKKSIEIFFLDDQINKINNNIITEIIIYQVKYFRFYQIVTELLFENNNTNGAIDDAIDDAEEQIY